jgi:hypothetical protein
MNIGKKLSDGLIRLSLRAALHGGPKQPQFSASDQFRWPIPAYFAEQPPRDGCPVCTAAPGFRVHCGKAANVCPMAARNPDGQPGSPPVVPEPGALPPGQEPGFTLPWAAGFLPWAVALAKLALQAATWWRQAK